MGKSPFTPVYDHIAAHLKEARIRAGLRPADLSVRAGLAPSTVSRMERAMCGAPSTETLMRWCVACGCEPASLFPTLAETKELL